MEKSKLASLRGATTMFFLLLVLVSLFASGHCRMTNFADCMKNPFAANCRGISAKRSSPQQQQPASSRFELAPSQQDIWQPDLPGVTRQAISHRIIQQPQNSLFYQLLLPIPTLNINYKTPSAQQQLNGYNNNNAFEALVEG